MRKNIILIIALLGFISFNACEKDAEKVIISDSPTAPALTSPSSMAFTKADADNTIDFAWSAASFGFDASITYGVQLATDDAFSDAATLFTTSELTGSAVVSDINSILLALDFDINEAATIKCRVYASVNPLVDMAYSSVTDFTVTPYETLVDYPMVYVPGNYQGWAPGADIGRLYSYNFDDVYEGIVRLNDESGTTMFKITSDPDWDHTNWGGVLVDGAGALNSSGGDYSIPNGTYAFSADVGALTLALTATDDWGIIGGAVPPYDWSVDVDMFYNGQRKMWEITADFGDGDYKFRANDAWDLNYGDDGADGSLNAGGANIALPQGAGNYTIRFDPVALTHTVMKN